MAFALKGTGSASTANSVTANQASLVVTTATTAGAVGDLAVLLYSVDNNQTTDGDEVAVTSVVDSAGNKWLKAVEFTNGQGTAQTGAVCGIWYSNLKIALPIAGTVTLTFSNAASRDASAASLTYYTKAAGFDAFLAGTPGTLANDGAAAGSLDVTTANIACLRVRAIASESNVVTALTATASWAIVTQAVAVIAAATSMGTRGEWIISTGTGSASAPTAGAGAVDNASVYAAFKEVAVFAPVPLSEPVRTKRGLTPALLTPYFATRHIPPNPIVRASITSQAYAPRTNTTLAAPTGLTDGDIIICNLMVQGAIGGAASPTVTPPTGFTELSTSPIDYTDSAGQHGTTHIYWKRASGESGSYTFTHAASPNTQAMMMAISGAVATGDPIDASAGLAHNSGVGGQTATNPGVTTTVANDLLLYFVNDWDGPTKAPPTGYTEVFDTTVIEVAWKNLGGAGATGSTTQTVNSDPASPWGTFTVAIEPAVPTVSSETSVSSWFQPFSQPFKQMGAKSRIAGAALLAATGLFAPVFTPPATAVDMDWLSPLSEPIREVRVPHKVTLFKFTAVTTTEDVTVDKWFDALSEPTRTEPRRTAAPDQTWVPIVAAEVVTVDKWRSPWSEPARLSYTIIPDQSYLPLVAEVVTVDKWFGAFSDPARRNRFNTALQRTLATEYFPDAPNAIAGQWYGSFSEPARVKARFSALYQAYTTEYYPDPFTQWFTPLSNPTRIERSLNTPDQSAVPYVATEIVTVDKWFDALSEPIRLKSRLSLHEDYYSGYASPAELVTVDKWFDSLSEPVRTKPALRAALQSTVTQDAKLFPDPANFLEGWFAPYSDPVRLRQGLKAGENSFYETSWVLESVTVDKWYASLSEPKRSRAALQASLQTIGSPSLEVVSVDKWFDALSEPVRIRPSLRTALQPVSTQDTVFTPNPSQYIQGWYGWLSEPVRQKAGLKAAQQVPYYNSYVNVAVEVVTVDKWFKQFADPVRNVVPVDDRYLGENNWAAVVDLVEWFTPFAEPVRVEQRLATANQAAFFAYPTVAIVETVTVDKWFKQLSDPTLPKSDKGDLYKGENDWTAIAASMKWFSPFTEPVRRDVSLPVTQQQTQAYSVFTTPEIVTVDKWFKSYAEPIRVPARLVTASQQAFFYGSLRPEITFGYYNWLTEPVRLKGGLGTHLQPTATQDPKLFPNPARFLEGWYNWYSEPVRTRPHLNTALQRSFTWQEIRAIQATITGILAASEINGDVALFAIRVLPYNPPASAVVSLVEIGDGASLTSIVEEGDDGSGTSVVET